MLNALDSLPHTTKRVRFFENQKTSRSLAYTDICLCLARDVISALIGLEHIIVYEHNISFSYV